MHRRLVYLFGLALVGSVGAATAPARAQGTGSTTSASEGSARVAQWQAALHDGSYVFGIEKPALHGDTLVGLQGDTVVRIPLRTIDELRLIGGSEARLRQAGRGGFGALGGADDVVYALDRYTPAERRKVVAKALADQGRPKTPPGEPPRR